MHKGTANAEECTRSAIDLRTVPQTPPSTVAVWDSTT